MALHIKPEAGVEVAESDPVVDLKDRAEAASNTIEKLTINTSNCSSTEYSSEFSVIWNRRCIKKNKNRRIIIFNSS